MSSFVGANGGTYVTEFLQFMGLDRRRTTQTLTKCHVNTALQTTNNGSGCKTRQRHKQTPEAHAPTAARTLVASSLKMVLSMAHESSSLRDVR